MIQAVFDTNTLASIAVAVAGPLASLFDAWKDERIQVVVSSHILGELDNTLSKPYFVNRLDPRTRDEFRFLVRTRAKVIAVTAPIPLIAMTRADNLVLATVESAQAPYLVTGDIELQRLERYKDCIILSPRQFHELLAIDASGMS